MISTQPVKHGKSIKSEEAIAHIPMCARKRQLLVTFVKENV